MKKIIILSIIFILLFSCISPIVDEIRIYLKDCSSEIYYNCKFNSKDINGKFLVITNTGYYYYNHNDIEKIEIIHGKSFKEY